MGRHPMARMIRKARLQAWSSMATILPSVVLNIQHPRMPGASNKSRRLRDTTHLALDRVGNLSEATRRLVGTTLAAHRPTRGKMRCAMRIYAKLKLARYICVTPTCARWPEIIETRGRYQGGILVIRRPNSTGIASWPGN